MDLCPHLISLLSFSPVAPVSGGFTTKPHKFRVLTHSCVLTVLWVRSLGALEWVSQGYSLVAQMVKSLPAMHETWVRSLGRENPLEKGIATHSRTLAWKIPWMEEPGRLQSMGSHVHGTWLSSFSGSSILAWRIPWTEETALELFPVVQNSFISSQLWDGAACVATDISWRSLSSQGCPLFPPRGPLHRPFGTLRASFQRHSLLRWTSSWWAVVSGGHPSPLPWYSIGQSPATGPAHSGGEGLPRVRVLGPLGCAFHSMTHWSGKLSPKPELTVLPLPTSW